MSYLKLTFLLILTIFISCSSRQKKESATKTILQSDTIGLAENQNETVLAQDDNCVRGEAEPIIKKTVFPNSDFKLQPDKITGVETVDFENGDKLIIRNWGCESYILTFRFETSRFQDDTTNFQFWFNTGVQLMKEVVNGLDSPIDIVKGTRELENYITKNQLQLQEEIDFGGEDIRDYVAVDRIQKIDDKKFAIEISYSIGPL